MNRGTFRCEQLAQGCCLNNTAARVEPATSRSQVQRSNHHHSHYKCCRESHGKERLKRKASRRPRWTDIHVEGVDIRCWVRLFQVQAAATGKVRSPTVDSRVRRTASSSEEVELTWRVSRPRNRPWTGSGPSTLHTERQKQIFWTWYKSYFIILFKTAFMDLNLYWIKGALALFFLNFWLRVLD